MRWIDTLERRYGRYGIPNLINGVLIGQLAVWFVTMFLTTFPLEYFPLTRSGLLHGQLWRIVTFVFVPTLTYSPLALLLELYFYWWIGNALTRAWGDFRFTLYWVTGMAGAVVSCLLTGSAGTAGLFYSLFFAYAWLWPEQRILLFFLLPVKIQWVGWAAAALWVFNFLGASVSGKLSLLLGLAGFFLFFGRELFDWCRDTLLGYKRRRDWENRWRH